MFRSIRFKLTLLNVAVLFVILFLTQSLVYFVMKDQLLRQTDTLLHLGADRALRFSDLRIGEHREFPYPSSKVIFENPFEAPISFILRDPKGQIVFSSFPVSVHTQTIQSLLAVNEIRNVRMNAVLYRVYTRSVHTVRFDGYISVYADMSAIEKILLTLRIILMALLGIGLILTFTAGLILADRALIPIRKAWNRQQEFVADASHELRTPISIISMNLEIAMKDPSITVAEVQEWLSDAQQETAWMTHLVDQLLTLARADADADGTKLEVTFFCLTDIVVSACEQMRVLFAHSGIELSVQASPDLYVEGDSLRIRQMVLILLDNAVKYTPAGGKVVCALGMAGAEALLCVSDTGIGIPQEDLGRIFERFYRVDKARSRAAGGAGLGLAIVQWIADAHKAKIHVTSQLGAGTEMCIRLHPKLLDGLRR